MQELVEMIRRDHALLADLATTGDTERYAEVLAAHRVLEERTVGPLADQLGANATDEWDEAKGLLDDAEGGDAGSLQAHAEQMEQVVLARLLSELDQGDLSDATWEVMRRHEALGLGPADPSAMRADPVDDVDGDSSRPAGA